MAKKEHTSKKEHITPEKSHAHDKTRTTEKTHSHEKTYTPGKTHVTHEKTHTPEKTKTTPKKKAPVRTSKASPSTPSLPPLTEKEADAYLQFSEACKEVYDEFSPVNIDDRLEQLKPGPALTAVLRFMVMMHDLLGIHGVMKFNKYVASKLYKHLNDVQDRTGQKLPLARVLLDGVKATNMELLSGVTVHPLPDFKEPEYKTMPSKMPLPADDPNDEGFEEQDPPPDPPQDLTKGVGPGGPSFDPNVIPQSGTPVDPPLFPPDSIEESAEEMEPSDET